MHSDTLKRTHAGEPADIREVRIPPNGLPGILHVPSDASACVTFAHGSGSSRVSPRNIAVAQPGALDAVIQHAAVWFERYLDARFETGARALG